MKLDLSNLEPVRKDPASGDSNCPGLYKHPNGGHVLVAVDLEDVDPADFAFGLDVGKGERAVYVPPGVVLQ